MMKRIELCRTWCITFVLIAATSALIIDCENDVEESAKQGDLKRYDQIFPNFTNRHNETFVTNGRGRPEQDKLGQFSSISYALEGETVTLDLWLNSSKEPTDQEEFQNKDHKANESQPCWYYGAIRSRPNSSRVSASMCDAFEAVVCDRNESYQLKFEESRYFVYRRIGSEQIERAQNASRIFGNESIRAAYKSNVNSSFVELVLVIDKIFHRENQNNSNLYQELINNINDIYRPLNIYIALVQMVIWTDKDQIDISSNATKTLEAFLNYRRNTLLKMIPHDHAILLTGVHFDNRSTGLAKQGGMCSVNGSGAVVKKSESVSSQGFLMATMMGVSFNIPYDKCMSRSLMNFTTNTYRAWSSCSKPYLSLALKHGLGSCLKNKPTEVYFGSVCGNGLLESGEECDCGLHKYCDTKCCNAMTCRLLSNATCAIGECCDLESCHLKPSGTSCREKTGECDTAEYCDGQSAACPRDVYLKDKEPCADGLAYCFEGQCHTRDSQCKLLWGTTAMSSDEVYYQRNELGQSNGNCGNDLLTEKYTKCNQEDIMCGLLHCNHLNSTLEFGNPEYSKVDTIKFDVKEIVCNSAIIDQGLNVVNPGLVPNGAKCGENKMCLNQRCVSLAGLPYSQGSGEHGYYNSEAKCHCDMGLRGQLDSSLLIVSIALLCVAFVAGVSIGRNNHPKVSREVSDNTNNDSITNGKTAVVAAPVLVAPAPSCIYESIENIDQYATDDPGYESLLVKGNPAEARFVSPQHLDGNIYTELTGQAPSGSGAAIQNVPTDSAENFAVQIPISECVQYVEPGDAVCDETYVDPPLYAIPNKKKKADPKN